MDSVVAIVGNPNVGKTALFNALTGLAHFTGNYPGVTVERKYGRMDLAGESVALVDLPGTYSIAARSPDEMIVADVLMDQQQGEMPVDVVLVVVDASNLQRNLYLLSQVQELGKPVVVALNMVDIAERRRLAIDTEALSRELGAPVVPVCAHKRIGIEPLKASLARVLKGDSTHTPSVPDFAPSITETVDALLEELDERESELGRTVPRSEAFRILVDDGGYVEKRLNGGLKEDFRERLADYRARAQGEGPALATQEAQSRHAWARGVTAAGVVAPEERIITWSERIDHVLTHKVFGALVFAVMMTVIFQAIYSWAGPFMDLVDLVFGSLGDTVATWLPEGMLQSLVVDGIIAGVGSVVIFLPQILVLTLFIAILEDCGYMARAAFLMDRLLGWCGLSGQSFIPMLSSFACAIPGIMATRTIPNRRDRFVTIMVAPLMSCSARLPVYVLLIAAFVPAQTALGGLVGLQGLTLFLMYLLGVAVAVPVAWTLKRTVMKGEKAPFVLELPSYKIPQLRTVIRKVYSEAKVFVRRAGTIIFAVTIIVWALAYFPRSSSIAVQFEAERAAARAALSDEELATALSAIDTSEAGAYLHNSILGRAGRLIEPVVSPLGWDWRIGTAAIASFPAREIIVATLGTLFNLGSEEDETSQRLVTTLQGATWPDGRALFNLPVALSIMVFFALCCQCGATLATIRRETGAWRWPALVFCYMTLLAYVGAFVVYQTSVALGLSGLG